MLVPSFTTVSPTLCHSLPMLVLLIKTVLPFATLSSNLKVGQTVVGLTGGTNSYTHTGVTEGQNHLLVTH